MTRYLVTGGAGFIGSNFVRHLLRRSHACRVVNLDKLTYAGNVANLAPVGGDRRHRLVKGDICNAALVERLFREERFDVVVNFAAETHVDRSIKAAGSFIRTDVQGAFVLLEAARRHGIGRFIQISTDEVYGSCQSGSFGETDALQPRNPYSASKAGGDRLAFSYFATHGLPVIVTRASNNYGPYQHPEKLIPLFVTNALEDKKLPLYGDGRNVRDWLFVEDHCDAICFLLDKGRDGETYNIGGGNEMTNLDMTRRILKLLGKGPELIQFVKDRLGHDRRYSLDTKKIRKLGWKPKTPVVRGLVETVNWYVENEKWWRAIKDKASYRAYYRKQYASR